MSPCHFSIVCSLLPALAVVAPVPLRAAPEPARSLSLVAAVELALRNLPVLRTRHAQVAAARAGIGVERTAYLPRADLLLQETRATRNNLSQAIFPLPIVPALSGPASNEQSLSSLWGSVAGLFATWEPFDLGLRGARIAAARSASERAQARLEATRLEVAFTAADRFLTVLAAGETVRAARANLERTQVLARNVGVLVTQRLRPGSDAVRAGADEGAARIAVQRAEQDLELAAAYLAEALGIAGTSVRAEPGTLLANPPALPVPEPSLPSHPSARLRASEVAEARARAKVLSRSGYPRFLLQAAVYGRGSGALADGRIEGGWRGLWPEVFNWAAGLMITFPIFENLEIRERRLVELARETEALARYEETLERLRAQHARVAALLRGARRIAATTPVQLRAATESAALVRARYQQGLATLTDVADTQRALAQAEVDDALARLALWRAQLVAAAAAGDLAPFLKVVSAG